MIRHKKWCPNGCGKQVMYKPNKLYRRGDGSKPFTCMVCRAKFFPDDVGVRNRSSRVFKGTRVTELWKYTV